eukprot:GEMP01093097.1.p1 GENE.GEMP01093097.1~~GEMP01093097.1.p1  ORF type:complete len:129 (-),score=6.55 GEMP01093097.1:8-394(-)
MPGCHHHSGNLILAPHHTSPFQYTPLFYPSFLTSPVLTALPSDPWVIDFFLRRYKALIFHQFPSIGLPFALRSTCRVLISLLPSKFIVSIVAILQPILHRLILHGQARMATHKGTIQKTEKRKQPKQT